MRRAPPVTSAALGSGATGKPPCSSPAAVSRSGMDAARPAMRLGAGANLGAHQFARRHAGAAQGRAAPRPLPAISGQAEIGLFEPADLVAQAGRLLEFEIGGGGAHALVEIGDHRLQILALIVRRIAFPE